LFNIVEGRPSIYKTTSAPWFSRFEFWRATFCWTLSLKTVQHFLPFTQIIKHMLIVVYWTIWGANFWSFFRAKTTRAKPTTGLPSPADPAPQPFLSAVQPREEESTDLPPGRPRPRLILKLPSSIFINFKNIQVL